MTTSSSIRSAAVLGAGTMGAQIAAHLANAGVPVLLLDLTPEAARDGLKRAAALKPDPFFTRQASTLITTGGFTDSLAQVAGSDWIIEAVVETLDAKQALFTQLEPLRAPHAIVSSNTSGIPIAALAEGRSPEFRTHFVGTHFFNPPRYLRLVEIIPTADTAPEIVERISAFIDVRLGKGVVVTKDTPNFIANHIGLFGVVQLIRALESGQYTIEEIDAITGPAMGRPRSATFRTMDIAGLDVLGHVLRNLAERMPEDTARSRFTLPQIVEQLIAKGSTGEKAGQGFYRREGTEILALDPATLTYRPKQPPRIPSLDVVKGIDSAAERVRTLFAATDKAGTLLRETLAPTLVYAAEVAPAIAYSIDDVDRAMQWGFGWELGPFELWDAIGIQSVLDVAKPARIPPLVEARLSAGHNTFRDRPVPPLGPGLQLLRTARERTAVLKKNAGGSLVDLGEGVLCVELHSKMNAIGADTMQILQAGLTEAAANFTALVVGTNATNFSAGANLMLVLVEAQEGNWDEIDLMVRMFQKATLALRYSPVPVVVAPAGLALGGGCEFVLHADRVQAAAETYMGLVEVGVGLIPAGGGTKEMVQRAGRTASTAAADAQPFYQHAFETMALARVSTSAPHAQQLGYLRDHDSISMNRERLIADARGLALERVREGYQPPQPEPIAVGGENVEAVLKLGVHLAWRAGRATDHDVVVGQALARVVAGGSLPHATTVSEQHMLDLEREAFLRLCGERKTLERIQHTLKTGKPLRN
ncbi:MAG TPA: 3-hydroxyacyl-CoA dehydrogenase NAD-binding domain-containing protein [Vicinamibacterales bacterium]|nr:3-hydroxyacyl-CoA dehydrogenase NAD-binding domain-containing protein [Vicinamibacterales bacterium]